MKRVNLSFFPLILPVLVFSFCSDKNRGNSSIQEFDKRNGTAIILTGAAARLPQEAALLEELYYRGLLKDVVFISGVSSGALNAVALNGILSGKMTWDEYKNILFGIKNSDIFIQKGKSLPVNTEPARNFIESVIEKRLGYYKMGDLPFVTSISFTRLWDLDIKKEAYRMCSRKINEESDTTLGVVDVLMASTAFPVAFPPVRIKNAKSIPDVGYVDGGVGEDHVPYHALLQFEKFRGVGVNKVYIISRKSDSIPAVSEELRVLGINDKGLFDRLGISMDNILKRGIIRRIKAFAEEAPELIPRTYVWIPDFPENFLMFNFDKLQQQYEATARWAKTHEPVLLGNFLLPYMLKHQEEYELNKPDK